MTWSWLMHIIPKKIVEQGNEAVKKYHKEYCIDVHIEPYCQYGKDGEIRDVWCLCSYNSKDLSPMNEHKKHYFDMIVDRDGTLFNSYFLPDVKKWEEIYKNIVNDAIESGDSFITVELPGM